MQPIHILLPVSGDQKNFFRLSDFQIVQEIPCSGLVHKDIDVTLYRTKQSENVRNDAASRMLSTLMNPCLLVDVDIHGDCILRISLEKSSPGHLPESRGDQITKILSLIEDSIKEKEAGKIPDDLSSWIQKREAFFLAKISEVQKNKKPTKDIETALARLRSSAERYGQKEIISTAS